MCNAFKCAVYLAVYCIYIIGLHADQEQSLQLKNCTKQEECPDRSVCTKVHSDFNCVCWQGFHHNLNRSLNFRENTEADYCVREPSTVIPKPLEPKEEYLAVAIILVMLCVIVVTLIIYCFVALRPIKRTQLAYRRLQLRRSNHHQLEEFNDIDMTFRDARELT